MSEPTIAVRPPMPQECPQCGLLNPSTAIRCDCGYDLLSRPQYMAIGAALAFIDWLLDTRVTKGGGMFAVVFFVAALYPSIAASVKRCHDRDHSWLFMLLGFIPIANLIVLFELGFMPGTPGPNRYGLPEAGTTAAAR